MLVVQLLSHVRLFATPWIVVHQAPLWDFPGKNTGVGCPFLHQGIVPAQGSNLVFLYHLTHQEGLNFTNSECYGQLQGDLTSSLFIELGPQFAVVIKCY